MRDAFGVDREDVSKAYSAKRGKQGAKQGAKAGAFIGGGLGVAQGGITGVLAGKTPKSKLAAAGAYGAVSGLERAAQGTIIGAGVGAGSGFKKKKVNKAFTLNRKEAKKDALNVGATGAATGAGLGALSAQNSPMYKLKGRGKKLTLRPNKFPTTKKALAGAVGIGAIGAASGAAANVNYKKKAGGKLRKIKRETTI